MNSSILYGPFRQVLTMEGLPGKGPIPDVSLPVLEHTGILVNDNHIRKIGPYKKLLPESIENKNLILPEQEDMVILPGFIDCHTHLCFAGSRSEDFAARLSGKSYAEIASAGGGIWNTVTKTREADYKVLTELTVQRINKLFRDGITTVEVKSGYGLNTLEEIRLLELIDQAAPFCYSDIVSTCLAAHTKPKDFSGSAREYLQTIVAELVPAILEKGLTKRMDIFIEETGFSYDDGKFFLQQIKQSGFDITVHADQFTTGGSKLAVEMGAVSADHLEASTTYEINRVARSPITAVCLPGASLGMGIPFAPVRKLLDAGASVAIASDWNPGTAPMGDLLLQASILCAYAPLTMAETFAGITCRAASALNLHDRGMLKEGFQADMIAFPVNDYREILYYQGTLKPTQIWKKGKRTTLVKTT
jgi:imidazolonepropionase